MNKINNFQQLEIENLKEYNAPRPEIHKNINHSRGQIQFIAQLVDLFFTKMIGTSLGGLDIDKSPTNYKNKSKYPNTTK